MNVTKVLVIEGAVNFIVTCAKTVVGLQTGSMAMLADAFHSATDCVNNVIIYLIQRVANQPADAHHPYGHKKFEYLGIFVIAVLLCVVAIELTFKVFGHAEAPPTQSHSGLVVVIGSMLLSAGISLFERYWGKKLNSNILIADAKHTFADFLTTLAAIGAWQLSLLDFVWLDKIVALVIVAIVLYLAYGLFRQAIPVLVDQSVVDDAKLIEQVLAVEGVIAVGKVRSRSTGDDTIVELTVMVEASLSTAASHQIANQVEANLIARFGVSDVVVHVEPTYEREFVHTR